MGNQEKRLPKAMRQRLPVGIQNFEKLRNDNYLYVDKTALIYKLIATSNPYFLSRPRRFGKSLLVSTMQAIFEGKRELFKGLEIDSLDYDWKSYPVLRLDMSEIDPTNQAGFEFLLKKHIATLAQKFALRVDETLSAGMVFSSLIRQLGEAYGQIVVLIDEYDKPILSVIHDSARLTSVRTILRDFYTVLKAHDGYLRFLFLTGVSEFSQVNIFSGLNHLTKLTFSNEFGALLGYTDNEIDHYFGSYIEEMEQELAPQELPVRQELRQMYNGYQFCDKPPRVYNPYSVLRSLQEKKFLYYWYQTGTPAFLVRLLELDISNFFSLEKNRYTQDALGELILEKRVALQSSMLSSGAYLQDLNPSIMSYPALLYQTGYWTIENYDPTDMSYALRIANKEVKDALSRVLSTDILGRHNAEAARKELLQLRDYIKNNNLDALRDLLVIICSGIPYTIQDTHNYRAPECYYQTVFYMIFWLANLPIQVEMASSGGRMDAMLATATHRYIFEFKIKASAQDAIAQIKDRRYYQQFLNEPQKIILIGVKFDVDTRNITEWLVEPL